MKRKASTDTERCIKPTKISKVVIAKYIKQYIFKIPKELDLEEQTLVYRWYVDYNKLYIIKAEMTEVVIESENKERNYCREVNRQVQAGAPTIENACDYLYCKEEGKEEEEGYVLK